MSSRSWIDPRTPVLVGAGLAHRPTDGSAGVEAMELVVEAALDAGRDAGARGLVASTQLVLVTEGSCPYPDLARLVADRVGATGARTVRVDVGVPQTTPIAIAIDRIRRGILDVALVGGGEAMASSHAARRAGAEIAVTNQEGAAPDERWSPDGEIMADAEVQAGMWAPVEQYACIEMALGHAEGVSFDRQLDEVATLWAGFNRVAVDNPLAAFRTPRAATDLRSAGPGNRPLAAPYAKWHASQWAVDQASALLFCSAGVALDAGIPLDRWVFPQASVESSHTASLSRRAAIHRWPAMRVVGEAAAAGIGRPLREVEVQEVYSCFPVAVRVQQRELDLDLDAVPTVTGGMAFAGGPLNNFVGQATVEVVRRLRAQPGDLGMVTAVSGLLTKPGVTVWGTDPPADLLVADVAERAAAETVVRDVTHVATGTAVVVACTATYDGDDPTKAFVIADLDDGRRWVGTCRDAAWASAASRREVIGAVVEVHDGECAPV